MKIHLWSIYYEPEPMGIAPVAATLARELMNRGHELEVVTSHPHYPTPHWGRSLRPRRRRYGGIEVLELPVYTRRDRGWRRALGELSYGAGQVGAAITRRRGDVVVAAVPSLMAIPAAALHARLSGTPWVLWLHDIVSGAAETSGLVKGERRLRALRGLEAFGFRDCARVVTISQTFSDALLAAGVPAEKVERVYWGAPLWSDGEGPASANGNTALVIGNIGLTQNLPAVAEAFSRSDALQAVAARLRVTGDGVSAGALREVADGDRVRLLGLVPADELSQELRAARVGLVSQHPSVRDFNLPSKITAYMAHGLPVFAIVNPETEVADLVKRSGAGWVADSGDLESACTELARIMVDDDALRRAGARGREFAAAHFHPAAAADHFEDALLRAISSHASRRRPVPAA